MAAHEPCFVVALPRSRTAWMSAWLDIPHELMDGCHSVGDFLIRCESGTADAWLSWFPIREYFPKAPVLVIHRDIDDVVASYEKLSDIKLDDSLIEMLEKSNERMDKIDSAMHVNFEDIDDSLEDIWNHMKPHKKFDKKRAESYKKLNIQTMDLSGDPDTYRAFVGG